MVMCFFQNRFTIFFAYVETTWLEKKLQKIITGSAVAVRSDFRQPFFKVGTLC